MAEITLKIDTAGLDTGPFTITDNLGGTVATGVTRSSLLAGVNLTVNNAATSLTVTSTGTCTVSKSLPVDFTEPPQTTCSLVTFRIESGGCKNYTLSVVGGVGTATFQIFDCQLQQTSNYTLNNLETLNACLGSGINAPQLLSGNGFIQEVGNCASQVTYNVSYRTCEGLLETKTLDSTLQEWSVCIQDGTANMPQEVSMTVNSLCSVE